MDRLDRHILSLYQQNNRISSEKLGQQIGLSATACQRRLKKLRADGYILRDIAVLDPSRLDDHVTVIVEVTLKSGRAQPINDFKSRITALDEVQQCYYVAGDADFVVIITARSMAHYDTLSKAIFFDNPQIQKFHSTVVMENIKTGLTIPLTD